VIFRRCVQGADNSLSRPGRKQFRKDVRVARNFNKFLTRAIIKFLFLQEKAQKEIHSILTETLAYFLPRWARDSSAPLSSKYVGLTAQATSSNRCNYLWVRLWTDSAFQLSRMLRKVLLNNDDRTKEHRFKAVCSRITQIVSKGPWRGTELAFCKVMGLAVLLYGRELWVTDRKKGSHVHNTEIKFLLAVDSCTLHSHVWNKNVR